MKTPDPSNGANAVGKILEELGVAAETRELATLTRIVGDAEAAVVHPEDLELARDCLDQLGRGDLELREDPRVPRGQLYVVDRTAIDPYRKATE